MFWDYIEKPLNLQGRICLQYSPLPTIDTPFGRLIGRLVPDVVMINTFPRMSHIVEYMELTGEHRELIGPTAPRHTLGAAPAASGGPRPSRGHRRHRRLTRAPRRSGNSRVTAGPRY